MASSKGKTGARKVDTRAALASVTGAQLADALGHVDGGKNVRRWLRANGVRLSKGGKITPKIVRAYMAAHDIKVSAPRAPKSTAPTPADTTAAQ